MYSLHLLSTLLVASIFPVVYTSPTRRQIDVTCAQPCFSRQVVSVDFGNCTFTDFTCTCNSQPFVQSVINCISTQCSGSDLETAYVDLDLRCLQAGVSVLPSATTPGITASVTHAIIDVPTSTATATGTTTLVSPPSSPSQTSSRSSSGSRIRNCAIPSLLVVLFVVTLLV